MALRHYTDDMGRAGIEASGLITRGSDGRVYVTSDQYDSAEDAQRELALPRRPSGYFEVPEDRLRELSQASTVRRRFDQPGGGTQQYVQHDIEADDFVWVAIGP